MKKFIIVTVILAVSPVFSFVYADEGGEAHTINKVEAKRSEWIAKMREQRSKLRAEFKEARSEREGLIESHRDRVKALRDEVKTIRPALRAEFKEKLKNAKTKEEREAILGVAHKKREELKEAFKIKRNEIKTLRGEERKRFIAKVKARLMERLGLIDARLERALARFNRVADRVQKYIDKKSSEGLDTTKAQQALDEALQARDVAKDKVARAKEVIKTAMTGDVRNRRELVHKIRGAVRDAAESIRHANKLLREAVHELRALRKSESE